ncbi:MAG: MotA/TolQ/ExbB proton channel family protein [Mangrovibacterium sp.]
MKKLFALLAVFGMLYVAQPTALYAQEAETTEQAEAVQEEATAVEEVATAASEEAAAAELENGKGLHGALKQKFIEGGVGFMAFVLVCLILGLALSLERVIYLNLATTNNKKLLLAVEAALAEGGIEAAKEVCRNTRGPVASIFYQGLDRSDEGMEVVEKTVVAYGGVQTGLLEKGLSWMALFIALAPMLGFMGTVIGMIAAFDAIEVAGDISPTLVAGGIKVALITTVAGLIVAMILQIFYNYCLSKIDSIVNSMEDASISLIDILVKHTAKK